MNIYEFERLMMDYFKGKLSRSEIKELSIYLNSDFTYRKKFEELAKSYAISSAPLFETRRKANYQNLRSKLNIRNPQKIRYRRIELWGAAAIFIGILCLITTNYLFKSQPAEANTLPALYCNVESMKGSRTRLTLPDSTIVNLNGESELTYDALMRQKDIREVTLTGEAYFEVRKDSERPFIVRLGEVNIEVLGTIFNVSSYSQDPMIRISLVEGQVNVFMDSIQENNIVLSPGEQAIYEKEHKKIWMQKVDITKETSWIRERLVFSHRPLREILKAVEQKYDIKIVIESENTDNEFFSGSINTNLSVEEVLYHLDVDKKYRWVRKNRTIILKDK